MEKNNISEMYSETLPIINKFQTQAYQDALKGKKSNMMNYAKVTFLRRVSDFPTNKEYGLENWADIRTNLYADDELFIGQLNAMETKDTNGNMVPAYTSSEIFVKILARCVVDWSFSDMESGSKYAVTEANIRGMLRQDFDYLTEQFNEVLTGKKEEEVDETKPVTNLSEDEKKVSENNSTNENEPSEQEAKAISVSG